MSAPTRYQAVREALAELGPLATTPEVAQYIRKHCGYDFEDAKVLSLYIAMVKTKMSRKPINGKINTPSGMFHLQGS